MRKAFAASVLLALVLAPGLGLAATTKTVSGTVTNITGAVIQFRTTTAAVYAADVANATLMRRNGSPMQLNEILVGDKVTVTGQGFSGNTITAASLKNNSLYAHTGTFSGKISNLNPSGSSFTLDSSAYGSMSIRVNQLTSFKKNGSSAALADLQIGMTAKVKGVWERSRANVQAASVEASFRMVNISFTGGLSVMNGNALTVVDSGGVMYAVDAAGAKVLSKNGKKLQLAELRLADQLKITGKHISGQTGVVASEIKDVSLTKK